MSVFGALAENREHTVELLMKSFRLYVTDFFEDDPSHIPAALQYIEGALHSSAGPGEVVDRIVEYLDREKRIHANS